jgi:hypothetical protein
MIFMAGADHGQKWLHEWVNCNNNNIKTSREQIQEIQSLYLKKYKQD